VGLQVDFLNSQLASREAQMARLVNEEVVSGREARRVLQKQVSQLQVRPKCQTLTSEYIV
jgi:hypothetical protein